MTGNLFQSFEEWAGSFEEFATMEMDRLHKRVELLTSGPGGIMEMKQTIADKENEIARLEAALRYYAFEDPFVSYDDSLIARKALGEK